MIDLDEALRNIDVFCRVLVKKLVDNENEQAETTSLEPIENLLRKKYIVEEKTETAVSPPAPLIPLPQLDEPLIDVIEDVDHVKVLMQCRCKDEDTTVRADAEKIEICKKVCYTNVEGIEWCTTQCRRLDLSVKDLQIANMITKCVNNQVFEVEIPKAKSWKS